MLRYIFYSFLLCFNVLFGQSPDSLLYQLQQLENDTERVNQLCTKAFELRTIDLDMALQFAEEAEVAAKQSNSMPHLAKSENVLGLLLYKKSNFNQAIQFLNQSLQHHEQLKDEIGVAMNLANLGNIYSDLNEYQLAENAYLKSLHISHKFHHVLQVTRCLINIGTLKFSQQQFDASIHQFKTALEYANQLGDLQLTATCYNNIGTIFKEQHKLDSALLYFEESLKQKELIGNEIELADSYLNLASIYCIQKNYNQASNYLLLTHNIATTKNLPAILVDYYLQQSQLLEAQQDYQQAMVFLKKHYALKDSLTNLQPKEIATKQRFTHVTVPTEINKLSNYIWMAIFILLPIIIIITLLKNKR